ncbi:MAG TPA: AAA family ATPase [Terriglobales bacterium]|jgi:predicted ATPase
MHAEEKHIAFGQYQLDPKNECLRLGTQTISLRPKAFAVLKLLLEHQGALVTKQQLLDTIWPDTFVGDAVLKDNIRQLREALDDDAGAPRYIETAHRRGYRFIAKLSDPMPPIDATRSSLQPGVSKRTTEPPATGHSSTVDVLGRDSELTEMRKLFEKARRGERQIVFVTGEAGIGKTALVDTFARSMILDQGTRICRGQCLQHYGTGEAYLPVLHAIGQLCRVDRQVVDVLRERAPMWLLQMPSLVSASERESLSREVFGATRERMLREMSEALEVLTADQPLLLILEDLHWSDPSTLDLISYVAGQRQAVQLMLIGTYRPVELIVNGHPLRSVKRELLAKQQCAELPLECLNQEAVTSYLSVRFPGNRFPPELSGLIHERTDGNPLFMVSAVNYLVSEQSIDGSDAGWELVAEIENVEVGVPDSIQQMIEKQIDHLDESEQRILEAASVAGKEFSAHVVAAGLTEARAVVETRCDDLARHRCFVKDCGIEELPNGEAVTRYGFIHVLYQNVFYKRLSASRRMELHRRIGARGEEVCGERAGEIAAELAMHFERGRDNKRAVKYLQKAADNAIRRFAYQEAVPLARRGLELLETFPDTKERAEQEIRMQLTLGVPLIATQGYAASNVGNTYMRARELCQQLGERPDASGVLWGLWTFHILRAELGTAREIAEELLHLGERFPQTTLAMRGHWAMEITFAHLGEFARALEHYGTALSLFEPHRHLDDGFVYALNPGVAMPCFAAWALWFLGEVDQALRRIHEALSLARALSEPLGLAHALLFAAVLYQLRREPQLAQEHAEFTIAISKQHGLTMYEAMATIVQGWALAQKSGEKVVEQMRQALTTLQEQDTKLVRPHFLALLFESIDKARLVDEGLPLLEEALATVHSNGERYYEAELHRLKGQALLAQSANWGTSVIGDRAGVDTSAVVNAERCFHRAIKIAQRQKAKSLELRTVLSLARLYHEQARQHEAVNLLAKTVKKFTEGFDTSDLREARELLDELSSSSVSCKGRDLIAIGRDGVGSLGIL